jgi:D-alanyl-D-alanine carboxypeptidase
MLMNLRLPSILFACVAFVVVVPWPFPATGAEPPPRPRPPSRLSESDAIDALKAELTKRAAEDRFSGAVLIAKDGKPIFQEACGYADREHKALNTVDTRFRFGSMGKMFTAVAILQLAQAGKIKLDDPIGKYLSDYPNKDVAEKVTIHHLLTHTGGTGNIFGPEFDGSKLKDLKDYVAIAGNRAPEFEPGTKHAYSNYGFILLGRIIELTSGQSYYDYTREHIFEPAGMKSTGNNPEDQHEPGLSIGYTTARPARLLPPPGENQPNAQRAGRATTAAAAAPLRSNATELPYRGTSAGGGYSTVGDFLKFANALAAHELLDAHYTELLTTGKVPGPIGKYAYGFEDQTSPDGVRRIGHGGGFPGMNGSLSIFLDSHYVVVVLANVDPPAATEIDRFISERLPLK